MTFQDPTKPNDCVEDYQDSHLDYLCALGIANDIEVEEAILANSLSQLGFNPAEQKNITIHIPTQLLEYGSDDSDPNTPLCGIRDSLILNRKVEDVVLTFDHEYLSWEFFLANSTVPVRPVKVTINSSGEYSTGGNAFNENMSIDCLELSFDTTDSSTLWRLQISCGSHWFDYVCCKISFCGKQQPVKTERICNHTPLEILSLPTRVFYKLKRSRIDTIEQLEEKSDGDLRMLKGFGQISLNEVKSCLKAYRSTL